jgi:hypothetical protein
MAQAIHNPIQRPSMCESDTLIGRDRDPPIALAQVRTALIDIIHEADWLKHGIDTLDNALESHAGYPARRFILNAVRDQAMTALQELDAQEWQGGAR